jgi:ABC-type transporter Mla subunit MlaD
MGIEAIIALIGALVPIINNVSGFITRTVENLKQNAELTPAQQKALDDHIASIDQPAWWKPDAS